MSSRKLLDVNPASMPVDISKDMIQLRPEEGSFDPNLVVILAALLCALICALAINYIIRWSFHFTRLFVARRGGEISTPGSGSAGLGVPDDKGLKRAEVQTLPTMIYSKPAGRVELDCPICLSDFADGEKIRVLPECNHSFHRQCIDQWLLSHSSCPTCRRSLVDFVAEKSTVAALLCSYQQGHECPHNGSIRIIIHRAREEDEEEEQIEGSATEQSAETPTESVDRVAQNTSDRNPGSDTC
ncbi:hypothetical protein SUGI_0796560 [Cryptomeria japonica]|uniref:RING-H2 finger protein ATL74 n=1 Tax=Cryptomeria japonica TaxID=3369 RepID=UPI002414B51E|nr:RING-H2 finger protein ATL74 [Cryptomeria japonica]GLJ39077.1 hypothetical protein SUGI_0796560 [Cryptomeria japonica]